MEVNFFKILYENLSVESKWFLVVLVQQKDYINKEQLRDLTNKAYVKAKELDENNGTPLISSRYLLDIHTARLEGAGLVEVKEMGRMRLYMITTLGKQLLEYAGKQK